MKRSILFFLFQLSFVYFAMAQQTITGRITSLGVTNLTPSLDTAKIDVPILSEVVCHVEGNSSDEYFFWLRSDRSLPGREAMLHLLRQAFSNRDTIKILYGASSNNSRRIAIIEVTLLKTGGLPLIASPVKKYFEYRLIYNYSQSAPESDIGQINGECFITSLGANVELGGKLK